MPSTILPHPWNLTIGQLRDELREAGWRTVEANRLGSFLRAWNVTAQRDDARVVGYGPDRQCAWQRLVIAAREIGPVETPR